METQTEPTPSYTAQFHATPYNIDATGFYFTDSDDFQALADAHRDRFGQPVEEYEIQFIDGDALDSELFKALSIDQCTIAKFQQQVTYWDDSDKVRIICALDGGADFAVDDNPDKIDIDVYEGLDSMKDLAYQFCDDGMFGEIPEHLANYIDHDAMARDLAMDYAEIRIDGNLVIYRLG